MPVFFTLYPQSLEQCLAHSKLLINIYIVKESYTWSMIWSRLDLGSSPPSPCFLYWPGKSIPVTITSTVCSSEWVQPSVCIIFSTSSLLSPSRLSWGASALRLLRAPGKEGSCLVQGTSGSTVRWGHHLHSPKDGCSSKAPHLSELQLHSPVFPGVLCSNGLCIGGGGEGRH